MTVKFVAQSNRVWPQLNGPESIGSVHCIYRARVYSICSCDVRYAVVICRLQFWSWQFMTEFTAYYWQPS